jgi:uncharacterized membrane protein YhdT
MMNTFVAYLIIALGFLGLPTALIYFARSKALSSVAFLVAFVALSLSYVLGWLVVDYSIDPATSIVTYTPFFYVKQVLLVLFHFGTVAGVGLLIRETKRA